MDSNALYHHGIVGMRWGIRRYQNKDGTLTAEGRKRIIENDKKHNGSPQTSHSSKRSLRDLSDEELKEKISRLELEKRYVDLLKSVEASKKKKTSRGKAFVIDVLEKSGKNIATQAVTYGMGKLVNKPFKSDIVNPKKGQQ